MSFIEGHEHVLALQSVDTMNTIVNDVDLTQRLTPMIGEIVEYLRA